MRGPVFDARARHLEAGFIGQAHHLHRSAGQAARQRGGHARHAVAIHNFQARLRRGRRRHGPLGHCGGYAAHHCRYALQAGHAIALRDLHARHGRRLRHRHGHRHKLRRRRAAHERQVAPQVVFPQAGRLAPHEGGALVLSQPFEYLRQVLPGQRIERIEQTRLFQHRQRLRIASAQIIGMAEIAEQIGLLRPRHARFLRQGQPMGDRGGVLAPLRMQHGQAVARIHVARRMAQRLFIGRLRGGQVAPLEMLAPRHIGGIGVRPRRHRRMRQLRGTGGQAKAGTGGGQAGERQAHGDSFQRLAMAGTSTR